MKYLNMNVCSLFCAALVICGEHQAHHKLHLTNIIYENESPSIMESVKQNNSNEKLEALNNMGVYYKVSLGNYEKAFQMFLEAANLGYAPAQFNVANCYIFGEGVPQDLEKAKPWLEKASAQGYKLAEETLEWLNQKLSEK